MVEVKHFEDTNKELLIDLLWYLKQNNYDSDEILVFLEAFKSVYEYSDEHIAIEPYLPSADDFAKRLIKDWKKIGKVNFIRDINDNDYLLKKVKFIPYPFNKDSHGYIKDEHDRYIPSSNPNYFCSFKGYYDPNNHSINILFDELARAKNHEIPICLSHETIHTEQDRVEFFWYIMNIGNSFSKIPTEGHAMKETRRMNPNCNNLSRIPFIFDKRRNLFLNCSFHDYDVYKYLYFKLEFLLGHDFMNMWMTSDCPLTFLSKTRKNIDKNYGSGTFKYLYKNIQFILLLAMTCSINEELLKKTIAEKAKCYNQRSIIYMLYLRNRIKKNSKLLNSLNKESSSYNQIKEKLETLYKELCILTDIKLYQDVIESDLEVCNAILNSNDHMKTITRCISNLECLMTDCLLKDTVRHIYKNNDTDYVKERLNLYKHYVVDDKFESPILQNATNNIDYISHMITEFDLKNENKLKKKQ